MAYSSGVAAVLSISSTVVAGQRGLTRSFEQETIDTTNKSGYTAGNFPRTFIASAYTSTVDLDGLVSLTDGGWTLLDAAKTSGGTISISLVLPDGTTTKTATAIVTSLSDEMPYDGEYSFSASLQITGAWS